MNAVITQIMVALCTYLILAWMKFIFSIKQSLMHDSPIASVELVRQQKFNGPIKAAKREASNYFSAQAGDMIKISGTAVALTPFLTFFGDMFFIKRAMLSHNLFMG